MLASVYEYFGLDGCPELCEIFVITERLKMSTWVVLKMALHKTRFRFFVPNEGMFRQPRFPMLFKVAY